MSGAVRGTDPITSHLAAARVRVREDHDAIMRVLLLASEPMTQGEVSVACGRLRSGQMTPRFAEMVRAHLIFVVGRRVCRVGGNPCQTYLVHPLL